MEGQQSTIILLSVRHTVVCKELHLFAQDYSDAVRGLLDVRRLYAKSTSGNQDNILNDLEDTIKLELKRRQALDRC